MFRGINRLTAVILYGGKRYERDLDPTYHAHANIRLAPDKGGIFPQPADGKTVDTIPESVYREWAHRVTEVAC